MRVITRREIVQKVGFSLMHISRLEKVGQFPRRIQLGPNRVGWIEDEIDQWIKAKIAERDGVASVAP